MISLDGHFLPNEDLELTLMQNSSHLLPSLNITLFNSNNNIVTPIVVEDKTHQKYTVKLKELEATDSGTWTCRVHSDSPLINQNIPFDVRVLGMWQEKRNSHAVSGSSSWAELSLSSIPSNGAPGLICPLQPGDFSATWALSHTCSHFPLQTCPKIFHSPWGLFFSALVSLGALSL